MARKTDIPAAELVAQTWDLRTVFGKNLVHMLETFAANNNYTGIETFTNLSAIIRSHAAAAKHLPLQHEVKFRTADYVKGKPIKSKADYTGRCKLCGQGLRCVHKMNVGIVTENGVEWLAKPFDIGINHHEDLPALIDAMGDRGYSLVLTPSGKATDRKARSTQLEELIASSIPAKLRSAFTAKGVDIDALLKVPEAAWYISAAAKGDYSGLWFALDPGNSKALLGWARAQRDAPRQIQTIVAKLEDVPHCVTSEELGALFAYQLQERREPIDAVARHLKADLEYLADLSAQNPQHANIRDYGKVSLHRKFTPMWYYRGSEQPKQMIVKDALNLDHLTFAQAAGIQRAYPKIVERRLSHNRGVLQQYCSREEFEKLWTALKTVYDADAETWSAMRKEGHEEAETLMLKDDYNAVKAFSVVGSKDKGSLLDNALRLFSMPTFSKVLPGVVIAGRKAQVYAALKAEGKEEDGEKLLKQHCIHLSDVSKYTGNAVDIGALADKLLHSSISLNGDAATLSEKQRAKAAKLQLGDIGRVAKRASLLSVCSQYGIAPLKDLQPKSPPLAVVQEFLKDYRPISQDLQEKLDTLWAMHVIAFPYLQFHHISAETGLRTKRAEPEFSLHTFHGKKYVSSSQAKAIEAVYATIKADKTMAQMLKAEGRAKAEEQISALSTALAELRYWETMPRSSWDRLPCTGTKYAARVTMPGEDTWWTNTKGESPKCLPGMSHTPVRELLDMARAIEVYKPLGDDDELQRCISLLSNPQYERFWGHKIPDAFAAFLLDVKQHPEQVRIGPELAKEIKYDASSLEEKLDYRKAMVGHGFDLSKMADELEQAKGKYYALENGRVVTFYIQPRPAQYIPSIDDMIKQFKDPLYEVSTELAKDVKDQLWLLCQGKEVPQYVTLLPAPRDVRWYLEQHKTYEVSGDSTARQPYKEVAAVFGPQGLGWQWRENPKGRYALLTHERLTEALQKVEGMNAAKGTQGRIRILSVE
ncbi:hypothetical protein HY642_06280 [Candidatus Woesearchaeota archaeon]|nr:hypothetical protein [Candidatus Woesearchaeota archaeon]